MVEVVGTLWTAIEFGYEIFVRARLIDNSFYLLCTNSSSTKLFLTWGNNVVLSNTSRWCTCTFELADVHQCNKVDCPCCCFCVPLYDLLSFLVHCCFCIWNQHCLGWNIFLHILWVSRSKNLWETDLQNRLNHSWLSVLVCVHRLYLWVHPRLAEQNNIRIVESFLPSPHLRVSRTSWVSALLEEICPTDTPCHETKQHAPAFTLK